jgi:hypothetical protein
VNQIDIGTVLNKFNDTYDPVSLEVREYGIRFINDRGEKRELICRKNVKGPKQQKVNASDIDLRGKEFFNLKRNGVMMVKVQSEDHPRTIKTAMIYGFKDFKSQTWLKVFH